MSNILNVSGDLFESCCGRNVCKVPAFSLADARKVPAFSLADVTSLIQFVYSPRIVLAITCSNGVGRLNIHVITEGQFMNSPII